MALTKREKFVITTLQGRTEISGNNGIPAEFRSETAIDVNNDEFRYEVKAVFKKLSENPAQLRKIMSKENRWARTFEENVNRILVEIAASEKAAKAKAALRTPQTVKK